MIGYWLVLALLACAVAAVVVSAGGTGDARLGSADRALVLAVLGASDALGEGTPDPQRDAWVAQLGPALPRNVGVRNLAVGGSTLASARRDQLPLAAAARPDAVVCWLVVNDILTGVDLLAYERDLNTVLSALKATGSAVVVGNAPDLGRLPSLASNPSEADEVRRSAIRWNAVIARVAAAHGVRLVDLFDDSLAPADVGPDRFHPSPVGHSKLAARFLPAVERALGIA